MPNAATCLLRVTRDAIVTRGATGAIEIMERFGKGVVVVMMVVDEGEKKMKKKTKRLLDHYE